LFGVDCVFLPPVQGNIPQGQERRKFAAGVKKSRGRNLGYVKPIPAIPAIIASFFKINGKQQKTIRQAKNRK
jgi:hypothetical protein